MVGKSEIVKKHLLIFTFFKTFFHFLDVRLDQGCNKIKILHHILLCKVKINQN